MYNYSRKILELLEKMLELLEKMLELLEKVLDLVMFSKKTPKTIGRIVICWTLHGRETSQSQSDKGV